LEQRKNVQGPHGKYHEEYQKSITEPEEFWKQAAQGIEWFQFPSTIFLPSKNPTEAPHAYKWFPDGIVNTCYNCLDVHVQNGRGHQLALIYDSPVTDVKEKITYQDLLDRVSTFAAVLQDELGVQPGDRVVIYMPMIPQAVVAMLACARIGAIHSVVFGGFASKELATRIVDCKPKVIVSASVGVEPTRIVPYKPLLDKALELAKPHHTVDHTVIVQRHNVEACSMGPTDHDYDELMAKVKQPAAAVPLSGRIGRNEIVWGQIVLKHLAMSHNLVLFLVLANHTHYILYTRYINLRINSCDEYHGKLISSPLLFLLPLKWHHWTAERCCARYGRVGSCSQV